MNIDKRIKVDPHMRVALMNGAPRLYEACKALIAPRVGADKRAQLAKARRIAREAIAEIEATRAINAQVWKPGSSQEPRVMEVVVVGQALPEKPREMNVQVSKPRYSQEPREMEVVVVQQALPEKPREMNVYITREER